MKIATEFTHEEIARMRRAAHFNNADFNEWVRHALLDSLRCDEEDMIFDDAGNIIGDSFELRALALEVSMIELPPDSEE